MATDNTNSNEPLDLSDTYPPRNTEAPMKDSDLARPWDPDLSPVCTWCYWWKPSDGHYCGAWPPGGTKRIPGIIWRGANFHISAVGGEKLDEQGAPIVFRPHPNMRRNAENARLLNAYEAHQHRNPDRSRRP